MSWFMMEAKLRKLKIHLNKTESVITKLREEYHIKNITNVGVPRKADTERRLVKTIRGRLL
jgi:hypothetical protein